MSQLFDIPPLIPEGFRYIPGFISREEEAELLAEVRRVALHSFEFRGYTANRKVASFGYDYNFDKRTVQKGEPIPEVFSSLIHKVAEHIGIDEELFKELLVTEYPPGSVINWHRDAPPFELIAGLSLAADCTFRLRPYDKSKRGRGSIVSLPVARRSLYIIADSSRSDWEHSVAPVKEVRYSITLRTLRPEE